MEFGTNNKKIYHLHTPLTFGKHRGKTVSEILRDDPKYIQWMMRNIKDAAFSGPVIEQLNERRPSYGHDDEWNEGDDCDFFDSDATYTGAFGLDD